MGGYFVGKTTVGTIATGIENGGPSGIRTQDQLVKSQLLYQLS